MVYNKSLPFLHWNLRILVLMAGMDAPFTPQISFGSIWVSLMKSDTNSNIWLVAPVSKQNGVLIVKTEAISLMMS